MSMTGGPATDMFGRHVARWGPDRRFLIEEGRYGMSEEEAVAGIGFWTWDAHAKKYRLWWFDADGRVTAGTATYDESEDSFTYRTKVTDHVTGDVKYERGRTTYEDDDTARFEFAYYNSPLCWCRAMQITGVNKRQ